MIQKTKTKKSDELGNLLESAMENLRKARRLITDKDGTELLYHAGMTIRTIQQRLDPKESNETEKDKSRKQD